MQKSFSITFIAPVHETYSTNPHYKTYISLQLQKKNKKNEIEIRISKSMKKTKPILYVTTLVTKEYSSMYFYVTMLLQW